MSKSIFNFFLKNFLYVLIIASTSICFIHFSPFPLLEKLAIGAFLLIFLIKKEKILKRVRIIGLILATPLVVSLVIISILSIIDPGMGMLLLYSIFLLIPGGPGILLICAANLRKNFLRYQEEFNLQRQLKSCEDIIRLEERK